MQWKDFQPLRECPFCGGEAVIVEPIYTAPDIDAWGIIQCPTCGAEMTSPSGQEEVLVLWNRRADGKDTNVPTNAQRMRAMSDDGLAETLFWYIHNAFGSIGVSIKEDVPIEEVIGEILKWLQQPAKEEV